MDVEDLEIEGIIAFDGATKNGLQLNPRDKRLVYPMGNKVTIKNIDSGRQIFLSGHSDVISAMCVSPCGKFIASGQSTHLGFKAMVIVWDYDEKRIKGSHEIHKGRIEDVCFTCESNYLVSLGGRDDGNIVIWDVVNGVAMCGSIASNETAGNALTIARMNLRDQCFITGGDRTLKVWRINSSTRKGRGGILWDFIGGCYKGQVSLFFRFAVAPADPGNSMGSTSQHSKLNFHHNTTHMEPIQTPIMVGCYSKMSKDSKKLKDGVGDLYSGGVTRLLLLDNEKLFVGAGDGTVELIDIIDVPLNFSGKSVKLPSTPQIRTHTTENVRSSVTSMILLENDSILMGTVACEIYQLSLSDFDTRLVITCHTNTIYDISFPHNYSEIFATASKNDIRLWHLESQRELLRISVPNFVCTSLCFSHDGKMLVSAWNDGIVRAFKPKSGHLIFSIHNAHIKAVSSICITTDGKKLITGGCDGQVRVWSLLREVQRLISVLKEHRGPVTSLHMSLNDTEVISSSTDGTCIVWDIVHCTRKQVLMGNTMFMSARFSPNGVQILSCGTDRKIAYWETLDGSLVRELEGSTAGALNCLDISPDGRYFVTGSNDCIVKIWEYHGAETTHIGIGHAAIVTACKFSPDSKHLVTLSADGAIIIWKCPFEPRFESSPESARSRSTCSLREEEWSKLRLHDAVAGEKTSLSARSDPVESVHENNSKVELCNYDPVKPSRNSCQCRYGEDKEPTSERGSNKSVTSAKTSSKRSNRSTPTRQNNLPQCVMPRVDSAKNCDGASLKMKKSAVTPGDCAGNRATDRKAKSK